MSYTGQIYPDNTVGYFRIASAAGRQPIEPVSLGEFRIGSGPQCQLRLGDAGIPDIHTILCVEADKVTLKCSYSNPPVLVNGSPCAEHQLADGDLVELLDHRLLYRSTTESNQISLDEADFRPDPSQTAAELVDRLQSELQVVDELSETPEAAVARLLSAIGQQTEATAGESNADESSQLYQISTLLQRHHEASRIRLESLTEVLDNVVKQQKLIADTLQVMSERIQTFESSRGYIQRRASA